MDKFINRRLDVSEIVVAIKVPVGHGQAVHKNRASHGFAMHVGGDKDYIFDNKRLKVRKNDIIYMPKGSNYRVQEYEQSDCYAVNFLLHEDLDCEPFVFTPKNPNAVLDSFKTIERLWRAKSDGYVFGCTAELYRIFYTMCTENSAGYQPMSKLSVIKPALDVISERYTSELLSIGELSDLCGVSEVYFRTIFRKCFGMSPVKYINDLKISRAKELLLTGMYSMSAVAQMSGFSDISYFSRLFKKTTGYAPSDFSNE